MNKLLFTKRGFSLIELTMAIVIIGIMVTMAMQSMDVAMGNARQSGTEREMEMLGDAITGNPSLTTAGIRSDFGYVGDVGAFPPNLDALQSNPGGYTTWDGPYIPDRFSEDVNGFKLDEWGTAYSYTGGTTISSTGGPATITKRIADATTDYLSNTLNGNIVDLNSSVPGATFFDSVALVMTIPDGIGGTTTTTTNPDSTGAFSLTSLPAGTHAIDIIYLPNVDTLHRFITILPRHRSNKTYAFASAYFDTGAGGGGGSGSIEYVNGTAVTSTGNCNRITFDVTNTSGSSITITSMTTSWSSPTAFYEEIRFDYDEVFDEDEPMAASGDIAPYEDSKTIGAGATATIQMRGFEDQDDDDGDKVDMSNVDMTITFSDGSVITFNTGPC